MTNTTLLKLYLIFLKIGTILLGGGYVILPILMSELCDKRQIIDKSELVDYFALSQSLPGIVAANISMFIGYKLCGKLGAITAMLGVITVPFITIIILAFFFNTLTETSYINGVFWGVGIAVAALILLTAKEIWEHSQRDFFFYTIFLLTFLSIIYLKLSPVTTITICSVIGIIIKMAERKRREK